MHIKDIIDNAITQVYTQGELLPDDDFKKGYLLGLDTMLRHLDMLIEIVDVDEVLDWNHDAVFHFADNRLYRLDSVSEAKPFIEPLVSGFGGKKRYVEGTQLNGLLPGVLLSAPNRKTNW